MVRFFRFGGELYNPTLGRSGYRWRARRWRLDAGEGDTAIPVELQRGGGRRGVELEGMVPREATGTAADQRGSVFIGESFLGWRALNAKYGEHRGGGKRRVRGMGREGGGACGDAHGATGASSEVEMGRGVVWSEPRKKESDAASGEEREKGGRGEERGGWLAFIGGGGVDERGRHGRAGTGAGERRRVGVMWCAAARRCARKEEEGEGDTDGVGPLVSEREVGRCRWAGTAAWAREWAAHVEEMDQAEGVSSQGDFLIFF